MDIRFSVCLLLPFSLESSQLLFKDSGLKICKLTILFVVLCACQMWSLRVRKKSKLRACRKRVLERGSNKIAEKVTTPLLVTFTKYCKVGHIGTVCNTQMRREMHTKFGQET